MSFASLAPSRSVPGGTAGKPARFQGTADAKINIFSIAASGDAGHWPSAHGVRAALPCAHLEVRRVPQR